MIVHPLFNTEILTDEVLENLEVSIRENNRTLVVSRDVSDEICFLKDLKTEHRFEPSSNDQYNETYAQTLKDLSTILLDIPIEVRLIVYQTGVEDKVYVQTYLNGKLTNLKLRKVIWEELLN